MRVNVGRRIPWYLRDLWLSSENFSCSAESVPELGQNAHGCIGARRFRSRVLRCMRCSVGLGITAPTGACRFSLGSEKAAAQHRRTTRLPIVSYE